MKSDEQEVETEETFAIPLFGLGVFLPMKECECGTGSNFATHFSLLTGLVYPECGGPETEQL